MKLFCFLISFIFVNVAADITAYMREVDMTNRYIHSAFEYKNILVANGLEHVIKTLVHENRYTMNQLNFMVAVPERASLTNNNIQESIGLQIDMQFEIQIELPLLVLIAPSQHHRNLNLTNLGKVRRFFTGNALRNIILNELAANEPNCSELCQYIGLWMSTKVPSLYTNITEIVPYNVCILRDTAGHIIKYRSFGSTYWQVDADDIDYKIIKLKDQVLEGEIPVTTIG
ncbi:uncharacterized protein LOC126835997 isoform X2 [Adelges cooleyi]|uniref:uncharacterized protein LOC126835997 isoform X2 n=1 Tax=Adelges cooleyi TaxID=133065 RepID=UPI00217F5BEB|nr:uncharacterized protein LOC126835997 isoform X2 [Adelges cooleyi]